MGILKKKGTNMYTTAPQKKVVLAQKGSDGKVKRTTKGRVKKGTELLSDDFSDEIKSVKEAASKAYKYVSDGYDDFMEADSKKKHKQKPKMLLGGSRKVTMAKDGNGDEVYAGNTQSLNSRDNIIPSSVKAFGKYVLGADNLDENDLTAAEFKATQNTAKKYLKDLGSGRRWGAKEPEIGYTHYLKEGEQDHLKGKANNSGKAQRYLRHKSDAELAEGEERSIWQGITDMANIVTDPDNSIAHTFGGANLRTDGNNLYLVDDYDFYNTGSGEDKSILERISTAWDQGSRYLSKGDLWGALHEGAGVLRDKPMEVKVNLGKLENYPGYAKLSESQKKHIRKLKEDGNEEGIFTQLSNWFSGDEEESTTAEEDNSPGFIDRVSSWWNEEESTQQKDEPRRKERPDGTYEYKNGKYYYNGKQMRNPKGIGKMKEVLGMRKGGRGLLY